MLAWKQRIPTESRTFEEFESRFRAFLDEPDAGVDVATLQQLRRFSIAMEDVTRRWQKMKPEERWEAFREELVLRHISFEIGNPYAMTGSLRQLKRLIDSEIRQATLLMSAMPAVALVVAALGVANLMLVNVNSRTRQIAVMRAVGVTKSQIIRLVLAEAVTLGLLGSVVGLALGLHASRSASLFTANLFGIETPMVVPWARVIGGGLFTISVCLLSGIAPARRAARNNIVDAMTAV